MRSSIDMFRRRGFAALLVAAALGFAAVTNSPAAEPGETVPLEDVPHVQPVSPDSLLTPSPEPLPGDAEPAPVPAQNREAFLRARQALDTAATRLEAANAAYSNMMAHHYPSGDAKAAIVTGMRLPSPRISLRFTEPMRIATPPMTRNKAPFIKA